MKRLLFAVAAFGVFCSLHPIAQTSAGKDAAANGGKGLENRILGLEAKRIAAMVNKDIAALDVLLAEDLTYTHSGGTTDTKASFITLIKERGRYQGVDYSNVQVIPFPGGNTVAVRGKAQIRLEGVAGYAVLFLDVWTLRDGAWKMVAWQATRVP